MHFLIFAIAFFGCYVLSTSTKQYEGFVLSISFRWTWEYNDTLCPHPCPGSVVFVGRGDAAAGDRIYRPQLSPGSFSFGQRRRCFFFLVDCVIHGCSTLSIYHFMGSCTLQNIFLFFFIFPFIWTIGLLVKTVWVKTVCTVSFDVAARPE